MILNEASRKPAQFSCGQQYLYLILVIANRRQRDDHFVNIENFPSLKGTDMVRVSQIGLELRITYSWPPSYLLVFESLTYL